MPTIYHINGVFDEDLFRTHYNDVLLSMRDFYPYLSATTRTYVISKFLEDINLGNDHHADYNRRKIASLHANKNYPLIKEDIAAYLTKVTEKETSAIIYGIMYHTALMAERLATFDLEAINFNKQLLLKCYEYLVPVDPSWKTKLYPYVLKSYKNYTMDMVKDAMLLVSSHLNDYSEVQAVRLIKLIYKICHKECHLLDTDVYATIYNALLHYEKTHLHLQKKIDYPGLHTRQMYDINKFDEEIREMAVSKLYFQQESIDIDESWFPYIEPYFHLDNMYLQYGYGRDMTGVGRQWLHRTIPNMSVGYLITYIILFKSYDPYDYLQMLDWLHPVIKTLDIDIQTIIQGQTDRLNGTEVLNDILKVIVAQKPALFMMLVQNDDGVIYTDDEIHQQRWKKEFDYRFPYTKEVHTALVTLWNNYLKDLTKEMSQEEIFIHF